MSKYDLEKTENTNQATFEQQETSINAVATNVII